MQVDFAQEGDKTRITLTHDGAAIGPNGRDPQEGWEAALEVLENVLERGDDIRFTRWSSEEYDKLYRASQGELDPVKRAAMFIAMNDMVCKNNVVVPVVYRPRVAAISSKLKAPISSGGASGTGVQMRASRISRATRVDSANSTSPRWKRQ